jgi:hypothetical protein
MLSVLGVPFPSLIDFKAHPFNKKKSYVGRILSQGKSIRSFWGL